MKNIIMGITIVLGIIAIFTFKMIKSNNKAEEIKAQITKIAEEKNAVNLQIESGVNSINQNAPVMLDDDIRLDKAIAYDMTIEYNYTLVNISSSSENIKNIKKELLSKISRDACEAEQFISLFKNGVSFVARYSSNDGQELIKTNTTPAVCNSIKVAMESEKRKEKEKEKKIEEENKKINKEIIKSVKYLNKDGVKMVDKSIRFDKAIAYEMAIEYYGTLTDITSANDPKLNSFKKPFIDGVTKKVCEMPAMKALFKNNGAIRYIYNSNDGKEALSFIINVDSCDTIIDQ